MNNKEELLAAYDGTGPYCMTLQEFIDFDQYVRCFTFGKMDILPVAYDPKERRYLVEHDYLSPELGARVVKDAQTINQCARLRNEHDRIRDQKRRPLRHRLPESRARFRARPHHRILFRSRRRENGRSSSLTAPSTANLPAPGLAGKKCWESARHRICRRSSRDAGARPRHRFAQNSRSQGRRSKRRMSGSPQSFRPVQNPTTESGTTPASVWHTLLRPDVELSPAYSAELNARMRAEKLKFGDRVHCPFLRPFFLSAEDDRRVREVTEAIAAIGERVVKQSLADPSLLAQSASQPRRRAPRAHFIRLQHFQHRLAPRCLPPPRFLQFAEYNAESPAGPGYAETLAEVFLSQPIMKRFEETYRVRKYETMKMLLEALVASYREWGGKESPPTIGIVDWREVPTWSEFEILQARFEREGVPTLISDPRDLVFDGKNLTAQGRRIDLLYRRVLINDILARPEECNAIIQAYAAGAVCMANALTCKIPHKKAFFAVLTDERNKNLFSAQSAP